MAPTLTDTTTREARALKTVLSEAVEDRVHAAKRAIMRGAGSGEDFRDVATARIRRALLMTVGVILGVGLALGIVGTWLARRAGTPED